MNEPAGPVEPGPRLPIRLKRGIRLPRPGWGPLIALLGMILLLAGYEYTQTLLPEPKPGQVRTACTFRSISGVPCPGCGSTRAVKAAARLAPLEALRHNPLIMLVLCGIGLALIFRAVTGYTISGNLGASGWTAVGVLVVVLLMLNWWWVLRQHGFLLGSE